MRFLIPVVFMFLAACSQSGQVNYDDKPTKYAVQQWAEQDLPLRIVVPGDNVGYYEALVNAGKQWNEALYPILKKPALIFELRNDTPNTQWDKSIDSLKDNFIGIFISMGWLRDQNSQVLAVTATEVFKSTNKMNKADIIFNFRDYRFGNVEHDATADIDFESVAVHELGHLLGIGGHILESEDPDSVMLAKISLRQSKREVSDGDKARIKQIYSK